MAARLSLGTNYSPCFDAYIPQQVVAHGIYRHIRHPIYLSNMLILTGCFISTGSLWLLVNMFVLFAYYNSSTKLEEAELTSAHPTYNLYRQKTGRFLPNGIFKLPSKPSNQDTDGSFAVRSGSMPPKL